MRFAAWTEDGGATRVGLREGGTLHPLPPGTDLVDLLADAPTSLEAAAERARAGGETAALADGALALPLRGIGTIRNRVVAGADVVPVPAARRTSGVRA